MSTRTFNLGTEPGSGGSSLFLVCYDDGRIALRRPAFRKPEAELLMTRNQLRDILEIVASMETARDRDSEAS